MILPQAYYKAFFWVDILLMEFTPILYQALFSLPQNVGERSNIHSKILKKSFPICFQVREMSVGIRHTVLLIYLFHENRFSLFSVLSEHFLKEYEEQRFHLSFPLLRLVCSQRRKSASTLRSQPADQRRGDRFRPS